MQVGEYTVEVVVHPDRKLQPHTVWVDGHIERFASSSEEVARFLELVAARK